jgi:hypothetical protein
MTPPPDDGDSGAWLIRANTEWTGMVVAADDLFGYALASTGLIVEANSRFKMDLKLL